MYKKNEIAKARLALLLHTNMIGYAIDVYKEVNETENAPHDLESRVEGINRKYEDFKDSELYECVEKCLEGASIPVLSDAALAEYSLTREDVNRSYATAQFVMNCGDHATALDLIAFYIAQITATPCVDLFKDRSANLLWGRLACELLIGAEDSTSTIRELEDYIALAEKTVPAGQVLQERTWLVHYGLFILNQKNGEEFFFRTFFHKEYLAIIEINAPWLLRYFVVILLKQGRSARTNLSRVVEILERCADSLEDPILLFSYNLIVRMDFVQAAKELARCEDVFASDYFLTALGVEVEQTFMEEARLLVLDFVFNMHQQISLLFLAQIVSMEVTDCKEWMKRIISKGIVEMEIDEAEECVMMSTAVPSVYEQLTSKKTLDAN